MEEKEGGKNERVIRYSRLFFGIRYGLFGLDSEVFEKWLASTPAMTDGSRAKSIRIPQYFRKVFESLNGTPTFDDIIIPRTNSFCTFKRSKAVYNRRFTCDRVVVSTQFIILSGLFERDQSEAMRSLRTSSTSRKKYPRVDETPFLSKYSQPFHFLTKMKNIVIIVYDTEIGALHYVQIRIYVAYVSYSITSSTISSRLSTTDFFYFS